MGIFEDIQSKIRQIIQLSENVFVYNEQCSRVIIVLNEVLLKMSEPQSISNNNQLQTILDQLNILYDLIDGFKSDNWYENCLSINVMDPISQINETMRLISESLKGINISLEKEYISDPKSISNDLESLKGIFLDSSRFKDSQVEEKLTEIKKNLQTSDKPKKRHRKSSKGHHRHHHHTKKKKLEQNLDDQNTSSSQYVSIDDDDDDDNINIDPSQKYELKQSDIIQDSTIIENNTLYTIYSGKLRRTNEDIKIMVFHDIPNFEEKFERLVNVLTTAQDPNLESFVGSIQEPPYYSVVTRQIGIKLSVLLNKINKKKLEKEKNKKKKSEQEQTEPQSEPLNKKKSEPEQNQPKSEPLNKSKQKSEPKPEPEPEPEQNEQKSDDYFQLNLNDGFRTIIAYNIARAMAYLHSLNITHRDLCSSNVMIDENFNPRITNFANSRFIPEESFLMSLKLRGTSNFRAPEFNIEYNESVDVFAFAGILYELLTGYPPFKNSSSSEVKKKIKNKERPTIPPEASADLKKLIEDCWAQKQKDRPTFARVIDLMMTNKITFPTDVDTDVVADFYAEKMIQNADLDSCLQMFRLISEEINESVVYCKECYRIRSFLYNYQFILQTSELAKQKVSSSNIFVLENENKNDSDIQKQVTNLKRILEDLYRVIQYTMSGKWESVALDCSATEISEGIYSHMSLIYDIMFDLGFNVNKYEYVKSDLAYDFRFIYSIFNDYKDQEERAAKRMTEIEEFLQSQKIEIAATQNEIKKMLTQFKNFEVNRNDFIIGMPIGSGLSSNVFRARQRSTRKEVAIKEFKEEYLSDEIAAPLLRREVCFLVKLKHEYLIPFIGINYDDGEPLWVITEFVKNGELYEANYYRRLNPFQKTKIAFEIAEGMEYLHSKNVIHRDLKTGNILLDGDTPKITDFGYSRINLSLSMTRKVGTIHYMAPEVILGKNYGYKADVFSYGLILWEMYYGNYPFYWISKSEVANQIVNDDASLRYDFEKKPISDDLRKLIEDCKKADPDGRPSFSEIIERMIQYKIAYNGANPNDVTAFYLSKIDKRSKK